ncbi:MAG: hypothetical protein EBU90_23505 [Proteobacteria bacterium]|nr:hypothetical protein [Pseudomonadota bacterium]
MSGARILFPDFRDEQSASKYPFIDSATLTSEDGAVTFEPDTFIDASFYAINSGAHIYVSSVIVGAQKITLVIGDEDNDNIASTSFEPNPVRSPENGALNLVDGYGRPAGTLVTNEENLVLFAGWPVGTYRFTQEATEFVATTSIPAQESGVRGVLTGDDRLTTGDLWLIGDAGVVIRHEGEENGKQIVRVDVVGVPLFNRFLCTPFERFTPKNFVKTINNCPPDEYGNFTLTATNFEVDDTVLRITNKDGIIFIDAIGRKVV